MLIRQDGDRMAFEIRPSGRAPVIYNATTLTDSSVVFENAQHGFPQKIGYRRAGDNAMHAWIEGDHNGDVQHAEFLYHQVVCAGS
jgi:hypothetical protein